MILGVNQTSLSIFSSSLGYFHYLFMKKFNCQFQNLASHNKNNGLRVRGENELISSLICHLTALKKNTV